jgi:uncharacterized DUF497 family protein
VQFDWDEAKNQRNLRKHGIDFDTASLVFDDPHYVAALDRIVDGEERWQTIGVAGGIAIVVVAHTLSDELIRIISARRATRRERKSYEETN